MKKTTYFSCLFLAIIFQSVNISAQFVGTAGIGNGAGTIYSLVVFNNALFAATQNNGVYVTTNEGDNWSQVNNGLPDLHMQCMIAAGNYLFAGTRSYGMYRSSDNGANWISIQPKFQNCKVITLSYTNNALYMYSYHEGSPTYEYLWESADLGNNWRVNSFSANGKHVTSVSVINNFLFLGTEFDGIYRSSDGGVTSVAVNNGLYSNPGSITAFRLINNKIYAGTFQGTYKSTDNGENWVYYFPPPNGGNRTNAFETIAGFILAAGATGIFYSYDDGGVWHMSDSYFLYGAFLFSLAKDNNYVFAGDLYGTVYRRPISQFVIGLHNAGSNVPDKFNLKQNFPNPFNPSTVINFDIPKTSNVVLKVYDMSGQEVAVLVKELLNAGTYGFGFDAANLASGVYFYRLTAGDFTSANKMILLK